MQGDYIRSLLKSLDLVIRKDLSIEYWLDTAQNQGTGFYAQFSCPCDM
jgi:hypothetical protein